MSGTVGARFARIDRLEHRLCLWANVVARRRHFRAVFRLVSRMGDGPLWGLLILSMPLWVGSGGYGASIRMAIAGLVGLLIYKSLKAVLVRERPFIGLIGIECAMPPLDRYSFPSGHTLHAVLFAAMAIDYAPQLAPLLVPFAVLIALSRVVLGLHYPSYVLVGAGLGAAIARVALAF